MLAQSLHVLRADGRRRAGQEFAELAQCLLAWRELGLPAVLFDVFCQFPIVGVRTEILPVSFDSIEAVLSPEKYIAKHLALCT